MLGEQAPSPEGAESGLDGCCPERCPRASMELEGPWMGA